MVPPDFLRQLQRKHFAAAYLLLGGDLYLRDLCRKSLVAAAVPEPARSLAVAKFSLKEAGLTDVLRQARTLPMLSPRQVLLVSELESVDDSELEALQDYFKDPSPFTILVFEAARLDRRTKLARLLEKECAVLELESPREDAVVEAAHKFARELKVKLEPAAAEELVSALGRDLGRLRRELEKLRTYVGVRGTITVEDVAAVVPATRQFTAFELANVLAEGRRSDALARVRRLLEAGESPVGLVGLLAWLYRRLLQAHALPQNTPTWEAAQQLGMSRFRVEALLRAAQRFSRAELQQAFPWLLEADRALKSSPPDPTAILETLIVRLTRKKRVQTGVVV